MQELPPEERNKKGQPQKRKIDIFKQGSMKELDDIAQRINKFEQVANKSSSEDEDDEADKSEIVIEMDDQQGENQVNDQSQEHMLNQNEEEPVVKV